MAAKTSPPFDPSAHIGRVNGAEYLEVKWRLVWLRDQYPDAVIETDLVRLDVTDNKTTTMAVFRARIVLPSGGSATGWGTETQADFRDFVEKAETKAMGRALAALGFGTQFCADHEFGADQGHVVDAPMPNAAANAPRATATAPAAVDDEARNWTDFWHRARALGISGRDDLVAKMGRAPDGLEPNEAWRLLRLAMAAPAR